MKRSRILAVILAGLLLLAGPHAVLALLNAVLITAIAVTVAVAVVVAALIICRILGDRPRAARTVPLEA